MSWYNTSCPKGPHYVDKGSSCAGHYESHRIPTWYSVKLVCTITSLQLTLLPVKHHPHPVGKLSVHSEEHPKTSTFKQTDKWKKNRKRREELVNELYNFKNKVLNANSCENKHIKVWFLTFLWSSYGEPLNILRHIHRSTEKTQLCALYGFCRYKLKYIEVSSEREL